MDNIDWGKFALGVAGNLVVLALLDSYSHKTARLYLVLLFIIMVIIFNKPLLRAFLVTGGTLQASVNKRQRTK